MSAEKTVLVASAVSAVSASVVSASAVSASLVSASVVSMAKVIMREACRREMVARAVLPASAVSAAKEMVREEYRRGKIFVILLLSLIPQQLSLTLPAFLVCLAGRGEAVVKSGGGGAGSAGSGGSAGSAGSAGSGGGGGAGLIERGSLATFPAAVSGVLAFTATVATKLMTERVSEREQVREPSG